MQRFFVEQMAMYSAYHRDARNKATHFVGVPAIAFSLLIPMAMVRFAALDSYSFTLATVFALAVMVYWILLDPPFGVVTAAIFVPAVWFADWIAQHTVGAAWFLFGALFVGGWIVQLVGHVFEGRKPALADNLLQIFIAPVFLVAEIAFAFGMRKPLHDAVEKRSPAYAANGTIARAN
ncbi:MAG: DUF962 domain-containing protein [Rhodospirillaceae bacterium]|nr:DUF962 domain-containing protein [Rhodospirillaceae bacterium]